MSPTHLSTPRGGLARRLFALFVLVALLPLGVSDWLSHTAVTQVADELQQQRQTQVTRQVSRQVYDRLLGARLLIASWPTTPPVSAPISAPVSAGTSAALSAVPAAPGAAAIGDLPGMGTVFRRVARLGSDGRVVWWAGAATPEDAADFQTMAAADDHAQVTRPDAPRVRLHVGPAAALPAPVWLHTSMGAARWLAEIDPAHLWAPVEQSGNDAAWQVRDALGRPLFTLRGADYPADGALPGVMQAVGTSHDTESALFLDGGFGSGDWTFVQRVPRVPVHWQGRPLGVWLMLVAVATLLTIAWLARRQIRRLMEPLERLTEGTGQLAAGHANARVVVRRNDEIGLLAGSFNRMAERIEAQFDVLAGMTAIDRDILGGVALTQVVERVLRRLRAEGPGVAARIGWLDGSHTLVLAWLPADGSDGGLHTSTTVLDDEGLARWSALQNDTAGPANPFVAAPWLPPPVGAHTGACELMQFPLRLQGSTRALLALRVSQPVPDELRQHASDLRDRLSVAMAARSREDELVYRAVHDHLTGLVNRYGLHQRLDALLLQPNPVLAVLFVDLDHFKDVNDSRGHAAGDALLCEAALRLQAVAPAGALVSRQGGDEFAIVLPEAGVEQAEACARAVVASLGLPYRLEDASQVLGASVGIALCPLHSQDRGGLLRRADVALYAAKAAGRGRPMLFSPELDTLANDRIQLLAELRLAIERSEFVVYFQPRVLPSDGSVRSAEALVRWQHPERGLLMPGAFIALAESSGLIDAIGAQVLEGTCRQLARWQADGLVMDRVSVNVSPQQLESGRLPALVRGLLDRHGLPGRMLEVEVTESLLVGDSGAVAAQLVQLREWGVTIALDDFGTGYSSMSMLRQLPIDVMKIDRSFVSDICTDNGALAVASAIVALARAMSLHLVAEGVETEAQATLLGQLCCDELQGFLYSRALAASQFEQLPGLRWERAGGRADADADASLESAVLSS